MGGRLCHYGNEYHNEGYQHDIPDDIHRSYYAWAEWQEDRLAGIHTEEDGELTILLQLGDRMLANLRTKPDGWAKFEIVDRVVWPPQQWPAVEGYSFEENDPVTGDQTHAPLSWNGSTSLPKLSTTLIGLRVRLHKATIFSFITYGVDEPLVKEDPRFPV